MCVDANFKGYRTTGNYQGGVNFHGQTSLRITKAHVERSDVCVEGKDNKEITFC